MAQLDEAEIDHFYTNVGSRVRRLRTDSGVSQATLAQEIGLTRSSVANLEAGRQRIALHLLVQLAHALHVQPAALLPEDAFAAEAPALEELEEHLADMPSSTQQFVREAVTQLLPNAER